MHALGCAKRSQATSNHFLSTRRFKNYGTEIRTVVQIPAVLHDQKLKGSCEGQGHGQGIEGVTGRRVSAVRLWENAKRLQGDAFDPFVGTLGEYVIEGINRNGWYDYEEGEDDRDPSLDADCIIDDTVEGALKSRARKGRAVLHQVLDTNVTDVELRASLVAALSTPDSYLTLEGGSTARYQNPPANMVLGPEYRSGESGGHCERLLGYDAVRDAAIIQGSWGDWTWCAPHGMTVLVGCCMVSLEVLRMAWAIDVCLVKQ